MAAAKNLPTVHAVGTAVIFFICTVVVRGRLTLQGDKINVHIVPHTHDDVGWLSTVDQYYVSDVQYILDTVVEQLLMNKDRKFIYVEVAYLMRWWEEQTVERQEQVKELVSNGQLEFINGGWCMNDEAATHYTAIIDQISLGLRFIERTFGAKARPRVAWHIDPFGHSAEQATLFAMMGFDGFFIDRIDYQDRAKRWKEKTMEMVWRGSTSLNEGSDIFTGVLYLNYAPPFGFCFDVDCKDASIQDDPKLFDENVDEKVKAFVSAATNQAMKYATNNIMMTFGEDFRYKDADISFKNMDKLIRYVNEDGQVHALYSTPSIYLDSLHQANKKWTLKMDDFFPYGDGIWSYWTGYFTSRPALKRYVRKMNNLLQACKQLETWTTIPGHSSITLQRAMAVAQHHDAVSGTEKQFVANDYAKRLHMGQVDCTDLMGKAIGMLATGDQTTLKFQYCEYLNISACSATQASSFQLALYNPLGRKWTGIVRLPVSSAAFQAFGRSGKQLLTQVIPVSSVTKSIRNNKGNATHELLVELTAENAIPAAGFTMILVKEVKMRPSRVGHEQYHDHGEDIVIQNEYVSVTVSGNSGLLSSIKNIPLNQTLNVQQQFMWYNSSSGNNYNSTQASGAYIFRPNNTNNEAYLINKIGTAAIINVYKGNLVQEIHQSFTEDNWITQVIRVYKGIPGAEFEYTVGPIPVRDGLGKEIISRFSSTLKSNGEWYTDANGRQMQYRRRNFRPTWKMNNTEPVADNYYPVTSRIFLRDGESGLQFTLLTDRSQGGSSLKDGDLELMIHRRCLYDDRRGLSEALNETGQFGDGLIIRGVHHVLFDTVQNSTYWHRMLAERMMMEPILFFAPAGKNHSETKNDVKFNFSGLAQDLPENVHLLTVERLEEQKMLLRLENQFQADEPVIHNMNTNVTVDVENLFGGIQVKEMAELALGGNVLLNSVNRLHWDIVPNNLSTSWSRAPYYEPSGYGNMSVNLFPMDIRTFNVTYVYV